MSSVAKFYSQILYDLEGEKALEVSHLKRALNPQFLSFFESSFVSLEQKKQVIDKLPFSEKIQGFLYQLTLKRRWSYFEQICIHLEKLIESKKGIVRGIVYGASDFSDEDRKKIEKALSPYFGGKTVLLQVQKQQKLIRGIKIEVEGIKFDDSILCHLKKFKAKTRGL